MLPCAGIPAATSGSIFRRDDRGAGPSEKEQRHELIHG
ncbi:hypothetical protein ASAP_2429 [Asaia bogorensis]|uniref:Uncharacterized protein n=1 Tax=Asaia bogorensis TaxID=91915 RepID=A0A060QH37_9PROT|nr:hypothetical protein ASAP_2429 [Asaia bogorensis]